MPPADVVVLSATRTPISRYGGSLKDVHPAELGAVAARAAIERAGLSPADIDTLRATNPLPLGLQWFEPSIPESITRLPHLSITQCA